MKRISILIILIIVHTPSIFSHKGIPFFILSEDKCFLKIASTISKNVQKNIDILVYDMIFLNAKEDEMSEVIKNFMLILTTQQYVYDYTIKNINEIIKTEPNIDYSFIRNMYERDLINFGKFVKADAVMISSATILENKTKTVWDANLKKFTKKRVALYQGNIINCENGSSLLRVTDYFLTD
ncbi:MAG TPA: hypothetical protein PLG34_05000 [Spirochaetota bacterium]|jgi:hypothetical protein|nr:MAG: hypothetical protein BWX91_02419 [Spirochaetes bacterium ADurb.Bin133]HNZ27356.1 hypothetical protein [Spirochaetota bacterium]HPY87320.1 hypothetical protein [Spirochaetota bacterium]HQB61211.1 hypothetical protein [Spirochaetota bacterium]